MKLEDLPDDFTPEDFMLLDRESLDQVPYTRRKWLCQCKGCINGTAVRDYGISPFFFLDRNSKQSRYAPYGYWNDLRKYIWLCGKHRKFIKRLEKSYDYSHIYWRVMDNCLPYEGKLVTLSEASMIIIQKTEKKSA